MTSSSAHPAPRRRLRPGASPLHDGESIPAPPAQALLEWYARHQRALPWRRPEKPGASLAAAVPASRGNGPDPYRVWLSEVMLQQTTVAVVGPRWLRFLERFPDVGHLARAGWDEVAEEWAGLGYYARARNLHACAQAVAQAGGFPREVEELRALPGIGAYTAAAVAAIAFNEPVVPVDGNVERVVARLYAVHTPLPAARPVLASLAQRWMQQAAARAAPGDFAQALFDLGATLCTPRRPACTLCPWREECAARAGQCAETLPAKAPKAERPHRRGVHFLLQDAAGRLLLRRRPPEGLLGGMLEIPGTPWREDGWAADAARAFAPPGGFAWQQCAGLARHVFTHFSLEMELWHAVMPPGAQLPEDAWPDAEWLAPDAARRALPGAMLKLLALAPGAATVAQAKDFPGPAQKVLDARVAPKVKARRA